MNQQRNNQQQRSKKTERLLGHYGFIENATNLSTLRDYLELVPTTGISHADILQAIMDFNTKNKGRNYKNNNWDVRCAVRALHALGLISINRRLSSYNLTPLGKELLASPKANNKVGKARKLIEAEQKILIKGLLTNPPAVRTLKMLYEEYRNTGKSLTKYELGSKLGFVGEPGFRHLTAEWVLANGFDPGDKEGTTDRYARTYCSWFVQLGLAETVKKQIEIGDQTKSLGAFKATEQARLVVHDQARSIKSILSPGI